MTGLEAKAAWRLYVLNWRVLAALAVVLVIGLPLGGFSVGLAGALVCFTFIAINAGFAHYNAKAARRGDPQIVYVLGCTAQIISATCLLASLSYVAAAVNLPLQDANLHAIDQALGLDWRAYLEFVNARPVLARWLALGYSMIQWPIFFIPGLLAAAARYRRLQQFILAFTLALAATVIISALVPAIGVFYHLGLNVADFPNINGGGYLAELRDLPPTRDGSLRHLELLGLAGLVTFPSFHAGSAILYAWALWPVRWFRPVAILCNAAMLAATPIDGGHYFIDVIAGVAIAALAIVAARLVSRRLCRAPESSLAPDAAAPVGVSHSRP
jgi:PAP2 superfamily